MPQIDWFLYDQWNTALDNRLFTRDQEGLPVYVDCDEELLSACASDLGISGDGLTSLVAAVGHTLGLEDGPALAHHDQRFRRWRKLSPDLRRGRRAFARRVPARHASTEDVPPPPVLALLTVLVTAAGRMGADADMAANAYYPRLNALLGHRHEGRAAAEVTLPGDRAVLGRPEQLPRALRGQVRAAHRLRPRPPLCGIPQSQALLRATDRVKLPDFFRTFGLAPGAEMVAADIERLLDAWISATPSPVSNNLTRLWKSGKARERVSGVVAVELAAWDGRFRDASADGSRRGDLALTALIRQQFGRKAIELSFAARFPRTSACTALQVESAEERRRSG